ncbi:MAG: Glycosyl transferase family 2 [Parcubacteria group bacterium GW2011_GWA2_31_28]|nr:MAG: Glycosyl transferase family 2 [Parcubacteria group bacterium GW2011_GWA2_31_28]
MNSDDAFFPDKLEKQVKYLDSHPDVEAVFSQAQMIDEEGIGIPDSSHFHGRMNSLENRDHFQWLNYFFYNCRWLWHPSMMMRKKIYDDIGHHNPCLAQIQDFDIGIRLSLKYELHIIQKKLTKFRIRAGDMNASAATSKAVVRSMFEFSHVLKHYLTIKNIEEFTKIFPQSQKKYKDIIDDELIPFYVARQALEVEHVFHQKFALDVLYDLLQNEKIAYQEELIKKLTDVNKKLSRPVYRTISFIKDIITK